MLYNCFIIGFYLRVHIEVGCFLAMFWLTIKLVGLNWTSLASSCKIKDDPPLFGETSERRLSQAILATWLKLFRRVLDGHYLIGQEWATSAENSVLVAFQQGQV